MNRINLIISLLATLLGIGIGYFLFGNQPIAPTPTAVTPPSPSNSTASPEEYTCSMHPQIRQQEPGICPICEMDLTPLDKNSSNDPLVLQMTEEAVKLADIETTIVGGKSTAARSKSSKVLALSGKVQVDERRAASQVAHLPGRIEKLYVSFTGETIRKGQKVADIYSPNLITAQRELLEAIKLKDISPNLLKAARNKLKYWKIGETTIQAIEQKGTIQETFPLYADASGVITNRRIAVGDHVKEGAPLFDVMNLQKVWVLFDAYEKDLPYIKVGDPLEFTVASIPDKTFSSRVNFIDPLLNPTTRVAAIRTEISNTRGLLKPEMFVEGKVTTHQSKHSTTQALLSLPKSAVLWTGKRSVVYVKIPAQEIPSFQFREVEIGNSIGNQYEILSGIDAGEEVVTYGSFTIDAAAQLNNQSSMMNKNIGIKVAKSDRIPNFRATTPTLFKEQLNALANAYIRLKDALVATDLTSAKKATPPFIAALESIPTHQLSGTALEYWQEQFIELESHSNLLSTSEEVAAQRKQFSFLSNSLIKAIEAFGTTGKALYVQHCPMAFNDKGADWLATEAAIQNPYFGDKMMKCGLVKKTFE